MLIYSFYSLCSKNLIVKYAAFYLNQNMDKFQSFFLSIYHYYSLEIDNVYSKLWLNFFLIMWFYSLKRYFVTDSGFKVAKGTLELVDNDFGLICSAQMKDLPRKPGCSGWHLTRGGTFFNSHY